MSLSKLKVELNANMYILFHSMELDSLIVIRFLYLSFLIPTINPKWTCDSYRYSNKIFWFR